MEKKIFPISNRLFSSQSFFYLAKNPGFKKDRPGIIQLNC
jgi:hypothetical protein